MASGVDLTRGVVAKQTPGQKFFEKMFGPEPVQRFAKENPKAFNGIMREMDLFMGFSVNTTAPLGESINSKTGVLTVVGNGGEFTMPNAEKILTQDELRVPNALVVLNPSICSIGTDGVSISKEFSPEMRQFLKFYADQPQKNEWFGSVDGMPGSKASNPSDAEALCRYFVSNFGSLWRGDDDVDYGRRDVVVGYGLDLRGGVLVPAGASTPTAGASTSAPHPMAKS